MKNDVKILFLGIHTVFIPHRVTLLNGLYLHYRPFKFELPFIYFFWKHDVDIADIISF